MSSSRRLLIVTPWVPYPLTGACQQDRFFGFKQIQKLGYEIHVIAMLQSFQPREEVEQVFRKEGIPLTLVEYVENRKLLFLRRIPRIVRHPALLDGAALAYTDPVFEQVLSTIVRDFRPDIAWMDYTLLWPVLSFLKQFSIPVIIKSSVNEPQNCIDEHDGALFYRLKAIPKRWGEKIAARESGFLFAITPVEEEMYRALGARHTGVLPLRGLAQCFQYKQHREKDVLDVVFLSSNYNIGHNRRALEHLLFRVVPAVRARAPGKFRFHLTGKKMPAMYHSYLADDVHATGFLPDLGSFLATMDIAYSPWITATGMQQKVFEPLCRSLPLIGNYLAGYPFEAGREYLHAETPEECVVLFWSCVLPKGARKSQMRLIRKHSRSSQRRWL